MRMLSACCLKTLFRVPAGNLAVSDVRQLNVRFLHVVAEHELASHAKSPPDMSSFTCHVTQILLALPLL